jgi:hypothetical protein
MLLQAWGCAGKLVTSPLLILIYLTETLSSIAKAVVSIETARTATAALQSQHSVLFAAM